MTLAFTLHQASAHGFPASRALIRAVRINCIGFDWQRSVVAAD